MADNSPTGVVGVATDTISALKGSPMLLVMVVLNCAFIFAGAYYLRTQQENAFNLVNKIFDRCLPTKTLGSSLIYPPSLTESLEAKP